MTSPSTQGLPAQSFQFSALHSAIAAVPNARAPIAPIAALDATVLIRVFIDFLPNFVSPRCVPPEDI